MQLLLRQQLMSKNKHWWSYMTGGLEVTTVRTKEEYDAMTDKERVRFLEVEVKRLAGHLRKSCLQIKKEMDNERSNSSED